MTIGEQIKAIRKTRGISQDELSKATGMSRPDISLIEADKRNYERDTLIKIAKALNCTIDINIIPK